MRGGVPLLIFVVVLLGLAGIFLATGGGIPVIGDNDTDSTAQPTSTPRPESTEASTPVVNSTPTTTPIQTATSTAERELSDLEQFKADYRNRLETTLENDTLTGISPLAMQYHETDEGATELWLVYWECDNVEDTRAQRGTVAVGFANTAGEVQNEQPDRLHAYGVKNLETYNDSITYIPTSSAEKVYNRSMEPETFTENWVERMRTPEQSESEIAFDMTVNENGRPKAETAFHEHYSLEESDRGCPGVAESGEGGTAGAD